jgi:hypothetical protein
MDTEHIKLIQQWVEVDNKIQRSMEELKPHAEAIAKNKEDIQPLVDTRKDLEDSITTYISTNKLEKLVVNITDGTIKFGRKTTQQPLTLRVLKNLLDSYFEENMEHSSEAAFEYVMNNLDKKTTYFIKRDHSAK